MPPANGNGPFRVHLDLCSWLALTGRGTLANESWIIAPGIFTYRIEPEPQREYIVFCSIFFDGVDMGMVSYEVQGGGGSIHAGYAMMQGMMSERLMINDRGRPLILTIHNDMATDITCNTMFVFVGADVWQHEVLPTLNSSIIGGV